MALKTNILLEVNNLFFLPDDNVMFIDKFFQFIRTACDVKCQVIRIGAGPSYRVQIIFQLGSYRKKKERENKLILEVCDSNFSISSFCFVFFKYFIACQKQDIYIWFIYE